MDKKHHHHHHHIVKRGESLYSIALMHDMTVNDLLRLNPKFRKRPDTIYPGERIKLK